MTYVIENLVSIFLFLLAADPQNSAQLTHRGFIKVELNRGYNLSWNIVHIIYLYSLNVSFTGKYWDPPPTLVIAHW